MTVEMYFAIGVLCFVTISIILEVERIVEERIFGSAETSYAVLNRFCLMHEKVCRESNEFYCFFKKSAFDVD